MKVANDEKHPRVLAREAARQNVSLDDAMAEAPSRQDVRDANRAAHDAAPATRQPSRAEVRKLREAGVTEVQGAPPSRNARVLARHARTAAAAEATALELARTVPTDLDDLDDLDGEQGVDGGDNLDPDHHLDGGGLEHDENHAPIG